MMIMKVFEIGYGSSFKYHVTNVVMVNIPGVVEQLFAQLKNTGEVETTDNSNDKRNIKYR